ncbi:MAG TPA: hypothetical protein VGN26_19700 [Armatimonadota bacterium]|jgi:hypothetical protein
MKVNAAGSAAAQATPRARVFRAAHSNPWQLPGQASWGYYARDIPLEAGGRGSAALFWFQGREQMLLSLVRYEVYLAASRPGVGPQRLAQLRARLEGAVGAASAGQMGMGEALVQVNRALKGLSRVEWWGPFPGMEGSADLPLGLAQPRLSRLLVPSAGLTLDQPPQHGGSATVGRAMDEGVRVQGAEAAE